MQVECHGPGLSELANSAWKWQIDLDLATNLATIKPTLIARDTIQSKSPD